ncbi:hypothetical protein AAMO2058_000733400 [Amorphochlora amoebiformis]
MLAEEKNSEKHTGRDRSRRRRRGAHNHSRRRPRARLLRGWACFRAREIAHDFGTKKDLFRDKTTSRSSEYHAGINQETKDEVKLTIANESVEKEKGLATHQDMEAQKLRDKGACQPPQADPQPPPTLPIKSEINTTYPKRSKTKLHGSSLSNPATLSSGEQNYKPPSIPKPTSGSGEPVMFHSDRMVSTSGGPKAKNIHAAKASLGSGERTVFNSDMTDLGFVSSAEEEGDDGIKISQIQPVALEKRRNLGSMDPHVVSPAIPLATPQITGETNPIQSLERKKVDVRSGRSGEGWIQGGSFHPTTDSNLDSKLREDLKKKLFESSDDEAEQHNLCKRPFPKIIASGETFDESCRFISPKSEVPEYRSGSMSTSKEDTFPQKFSKPYSSYLPLPKTLTDVNLEPPTPALTAGGLTDSEKPSEKPSTMTSPALGSESKKGLRHYDDSNYDTPLGRGSPMNISADLPPAPIVKPSTSPKKACSPLLDRRMMLRMLGKHKTFRETRKSRSLTSWRTGQISSDSKLIRLRGPNDKYDDILPKIQKDILDLKSDSDSKHISRAERNISSEISSSRDESGLRQVETSKLEEPDPLQGPLKTKGSFGRYVDGYAEVNEGLLIWAKSKGDLKDNLDAIHDVREQIILKKKTHKVSGVFLVPMIAVEEIAVDETTHGRFEIQVQMLRSLRSK